MLTKMIEFVVNRITSILDNERESLLEALRWIICFGAISLTNDNIQLILNALAEPQLFVVLAIIGVSNNKWIDTANATTFINLVRTVRDGASIGYVLILMIAIVIPVIGDSTVYAVLAGFIVQLSTNSVASLIQTPFSVEEQKELIR